MRYAMRCANIAALLILVTGISSLGFAAAPQSSQQSSQSVAAAARKAQEKEKEAPKTKTVWTNDNIPSTPGGVNVVGPPASSSTSTASTSTEPAAATANAKEAPTEADKEKLAADRAKALSDLEDARKQLDSVKTDLDIARREYNLDSAQLYSTPDYSKDQQGQAKVDAEKAAIADKEQAVDAAQKKVDDLEKLLKSLGGEEKPAPPPAPAPTAPSLKP